MPTYDSFNIFRHKKREEKVMRVHFAARASEPDVGESLIESNEEKGLKFNIACRVEKRPVKTLNQSIGLFFISLTLY